MIIASQVYQAPFTNLFLFFALFNLLKCRKLNLRENGIQVLKVNFNGFIPFPKRFQYNEPTSVETRDKESLPFTAKF